MSPIRWSHRPTLRRPIAVTAFEGWNDAGDAASDTVRWLIDRTGAEPIARIDSEEFFDFTVTRPEIRSDDDGARSIRWPDTEVFAAELDGDRDVVFVIGAEPQLRWRTWCHALLGALDDLDVSLVVLLGSLLADIPHTVPSRVSGSARDPELRDDLDLERSTYEGPTGIVGVLADAAGNADLPTISLWAAVPNYIGASDPKAQLALVERSSRILDLSLPVTDLQIAVASYERQLMELVEDDPDLATYIGELENRIALLDAMADGEESGEQAADSGLADMDPQEFVEDVERFLRGD